MPQNTIFDYRKQYYLSFEAWFINKIYIKFIQTACVCVCVCVHCKIYMMHNLI